MIDYSATLLLWKYRNTIEPKTQGKQKKHDPEPSEQEDWMNPFSVSLENIWEEKKHRPVACSMQAG